jgi:hypothetical protein
MGKPRSNLPRSSGPSDLETLQPEESDGRVLAILGGSERKGYWEPPIHLRVYALLGGVELDFREASLFEGETVVEIFALMGGANITVPPDIHIRTSGTGVMGGFTSIEHHAPDADAPTLHIKGVAVMGGVEIIVKKPSLLTRLRSD